MQLNASSLKKISRTMKIDCHHVYNMSDLQEAFLWVNLFYLSLTFVDQFDLSLNNGLDFSCCYVFW